MYLRLTRNLNSIGKLIPETENPFNLINQDEDYYLSIYKYSEDQKKYATEIIEKVAKETKEAYTGPRGVSGILEVVTNKLVFDFDSSDLEIARQSTITAYERLLEIGFKNKDIQVSFSGNKGFSIVIEHDQELTPKQHKAIGKSIAGDLEGFDTKVYNASRIFRLDYTKHQESGLYKTPIAYSQLKSLDAEKIKNLAKKKRNPKYVKNVAAFPKKLLEIKPEEVVVTDSSIEVDIKNIDLSKKPSFLTPEKYILHKGHIPPTYGNEGMMILAATYRASGFDAVDAYNMLISVNEKRGIIYGEGAKRDESDIKNQIIDVVYSKTWQGGAYSYKGNELLATLKEKYCQNSETKNLSKISNIKDRFKKFVKNINKNIIKSGIKSLDDNVMFMTGQLVGVLAAPGAGKTSLVTTIMENLSRKGTAVLFESLDMHDNMMVMRMIQKLTGLDVEKKMRKMIEDDPLFDKDYDMFEDKEVIDAIMHMEEVYKNVDFNFKRGTTVEDIDQHIAKAKEEHGDNLKLVVVDYLEKVPTQFSDPTASTGMVARQLSDLASKHDVCVILLLQPQKSAGDASEELLSMRKIKGASVIEQDCRVILTMWRPGFNPADSSADKYVSIAVVKNNMGDVCKLDYGWNGLRGTLRELTMYEKAELSDLIEKRKEEKKSEDSW